MSELRRFIRHPADVPIEFSTADHPGISHPGLTQDVSFGGLAFQAEECPERGSLIIVRIPVVDPPFEMEGEVVWCRRTTGQRVEVGVRFLGSADAFRARMVEQVCYIEQYRREVLEQEGRDLDATTAAAEWIRKYASKFPGSEDAA